MSNKMIGVMIFAIVAQVAIWGSVIYAAWWLLNKAIDAFGN